jgi:hypothetical protein
MRGSDSRVEIENGGMSKSMNEGGERGTVACLTKYLLWTKVDCLYFQKRMDTVKHAVTLVVDSQVLNEEFRYLKV